MPETKKYFYGHEVSSYGVEHNRVDYRTLAKCFDAVLCNGIIENTEGIGYWDLISGYTDNSYEISELQDQISDLEDQISDLEDENIHDPKISELQDQISDLEDQISDLEDEQEPNEIFQYYIVSSDAVEVLEEAHEIIFYNDVLDLYVWGVTHWGTAWDYVLTNIKIDK